MSPGPDSCSKCFPGSPSATEQILTFRGNSALIAQLVKNSPAVQETPVRFLGWEDPLEKGKATHSSILAWRIPEVCGVARSRT